MPRRGAVKDDRENKGKKEAEIGKGRSSQGIEENKVEKVDKSEEVNKIGGKKKAKQIMEKDDERVRENKIGENIRATQTMVKDEEREREKKIG